MNEELVDKVGNGLRVNTNMEWTFTSNDSSSDLRPFKFRFRNLKSVIIVHHVLSFAFIIIFLFRIFILNLRLQKLNFNKMVILSADHNWLLTDYCISLGPFDFVTSHARVSAELFTRMWHFTIFSILFYF